MRIKFHKGFAKQVLGVTITASLTACGGGSSDNAPGTSAPQSAPNLTGKAIDGYLAGATVCLDLNSNGVCDGEEPSAVTDDNGNYGLVVNGNVIGRKLLVVVSSATKDKSRPGYTFPANIALSGIVDGATEQNVTPLTSMIVAQMEAGASKAAALQSVAALVGANVDPKRDYVAAGDQNTLATATSIVDKLSAFAKTGQNNTATVRAVLNAIATKGDVATVSQADVDAQASKPVYAVDVNVASLLADPLFSYDHTNYSNGVPTMVRLRWTLTGQQLRDDPEAYGTKGWAAITANNFGGDPGEYFLTSAGTWSRFYTAAEALKPVTVQAIDNASLSFTESVLNNSRVSSADITQPTRAVV
ncbi:hypothetical protein [Ralstonia solanacearum]|uniref:hypothetical protein n=1 Tax=Ralstonia solanacearum TaxID=305 RepID=UPI003CC625AB